MADTIAAIATAVGKGGISIIRISGEHAHEIAQNLFQPKRKFEMRKMYYGSIVFQSTVLDKCLCVMFEQNASYTGESTAEIHCHGGYAAARDVLNAVYSLGARAAQNGEFTRRAFLNGKIDLSQAEAVGDMIDAEVQSASRTAAKILSGELGDKIRGFQNKIKEVVTEIEAGIDYPDEIEEQATSEKIMATAKALIPEIQALIAGYKRGRIIKGGLQVCIIGKPNSGKSSLLNVLCGYDRAIVTPIPGTTRDTLHEVLDLGGVSVNLFDTAGIRESSDQIETAGIDRSKSTAKASDVLLCVVDSSVPVEFDAFDLNEFRDKPGLVLFNKCDLCVYPQIELPNGWQRIDTSTKSGEGIAELIEYLRGICAQCDADGTVTITSERHLEALKNAEADLNAALVEMPADILSIDLLHAWSELGKITGETVTEDIIDYIFSKFCVGK